jgi:hypothetical protein
MPTVYISAEHAVDLADHSEVVGQTQAAINASALDDFFREVAPIQKEEAERKRKLKLIRQDDS